MKHLKIFESDNYNESQVFPYVFYISDSSTLINDKNYIVADGEFGDGQFSWEFYESGELILSGEGEMPEFWEGCPWETVKSQVKSIIVNEGITCLGWGSFSGCVNVEKTILPKSLQYVPDDTFLNCSGTLIIQSNISKDYGSIQAKFNKLILTKEVTEYNMGSISPELECIVIDKDNPVFSSEQHCNSIIEKQSNKLILGSSNIFIPSNVTSIGNSACRKINLTSIYIPSTVTSIEEYAFYECPNLTTINIPESMTSIGEFAFAYCPNLTTINIPENSQMTSIEYYAFDGCSSLTAINIPEGVTSIGDAAFGDCSSLTSINIPASVTSIGEWAFAGCSSFTAITCKATTPPTIGGSDTFDEVDKSIPVYVPASSVEAYKVANGWSEFTNIQAIPEI